MMNDVMHGASPGGPGGGAVPGVGGDHLSNPMANGAVAAMGGPPGQPGQQPGGGGGAQNRDEI